MLSMFIQSPQGLHATFGVYPLKSGLLQAVTCWRIVSKLLFQAQVKLGVVFIQRQILNKLAASYNMQMDPPYPPSDFCRFNSKATFG